MADDRTPAQEAEAEGTNRATDARRLMTAGEPRARHQAPNGDARVRKNRANEADLVINEGQLYVEKDGGKREVIPFFVDTAAAQVHFAPLGSSHEEILRMPEFVQRFEPSAQSVLAEASPEESQKDAEARIKRRETTNQLGHVVERNGKPVRE